MTRLTLGFHIFLALTLVVTPLFASAQTYNTGISQDTYTTGVTPDTYTTGVSQNQTCQPDGTGCTLQNPLAAGSFCGLIKLVFGVVLQLGIPVAVVFLILSGARFVFAQGNEKALSAAKRNLFYTVLGIGLFLGAWVIIMAVSATLQALGITLISCS